MTAKFSLLLIVLTVCFWHVTYTFRVNLLSVIPRNSLLKMSRISEFKGTVMQII